VVELVGYGKELDGEQRHHRQSHRLAEVLGLLPEVTEAVEAQRNKRGVEQIDLKVQVEGSLPHPHPKGRFQRVFVDA
jgi:hypothetical protein